jgi:hypothetical protein
MVQPGFLLDSKLILFQFFSNEFPLEPSISTFRRNPSSFTFAPKLSNENSETYEELITFFIKPRLTDALNFIVSVWVEFQGNKSTSILRTFSAAGIRLNRLGYSRRRRLKIVVFPDIHLH